MWKKAITYINLNKNKIKRCNSCCNRYESKNIINQIKNHSETNRPKQKKQESNIGIYKQFNSDRIIKVDNKIKKIISKPLKSKVQNKTIKK